RMRFLQIACQRNRGSLTRGAQRLQRLPAAQPPRALGSTPCSRRDRSLSLEWLSAPLRAVGNLNTRSRRNEVPLPQRRSSRRGRTMWSSPSFTRKECPFATTPSALHVRPPKRTHKDRPCFVTLAHRTT